MQPFDENSIKKAFDKWENEPATLAYNKAGILSRLSIGKMLSWQQRLMQVAAIALILLLSGSLGYTVLNNERAGNRNDLLANEQIEQKQQIQLLLDSIAQLSSKTKVEYITVVKEKKIPDPNCNENELQMQNQIAQLKNENMALKTSLNQLSLATADLNDSIQQLLANMSDIEQEYQMVINDMKSKKSFEINVDQELIASTSDNLNTTPIQIKEDKLQFKLGNKSSKTTAPIRKSFSFR